MGGSQLITSGIGSSNSGMAFPHQVSLREFLTSSPGPISPLQTASSLPSLIASPTTIMTASSMPRNTSSPLNTVLTKAMSNMTSPAIALSPTSLSTTSDIINDSKQTKLILVEPQNEQNSTLQYLQSPVVTVSTPSSLILPNQLATGVITTTSLIQNGEVNKPGTRASTTSTDNSSSNNNTDDEQKMVSLTAAGTPRKREPVDPSRCIYPCDCCGKAFTTKFNLKRHINMHCSPSKEAGVPLQGPPSASQPSRKSREKREAKIAASEPPEESISLVHVPVSAINATTKSHESILSLSGGKKLKRSARQAKKRNHSTEVSLSTLNDQSQPRAQTSNVQTIVTRSAAVTLNSITNSNSPIVIQSNIVPSTSVIPAPSKIKNLTIPSGAATGVFTVEGKNKEQQQGSIQVVQPKTITYQIGPSSDGTLQFTLAPPSQQHSLQLPSHIRGITHNLNKGGSSILPVSISSETSKPVENQTAFNSSIGTAITRDKETTKQGMSISLPQHTTAQLTQPFKTVVTTPNIRDLIEKHRPKISVTSTQASSVTTPQQQPSLITVSNNQAASDTVAVQMIQNLAPVEVFGNRGGAFNSQQPPRIVRLIHHPVSTASTPKTYLTSISTPPSGASSMIKPQHILQQGHQQITLQPPHNTIPTTIGNVPMIQLPPLSLQQPTLTTASLAMAPQTIQFPQQPIPLVQALASTSGNDSNQAPKQIFLSSSSTPGHTNISELLPQAISRFISGSDGNITLQQTTSNSNNTLPAGTVLAVRSAPTTSIEQITLPNAPLQNLAKICPSIRHGDDSQTRNVVPTSISLLSGTSVSLQPDPLAKYILPQSTISHTTQPSVNCLENSPVVFGNTPPAEIFDSDDGEGGSSIATTYEMSSPPPTSSYHNPRNWANSSGDSPTMVSPVTQNDPFVSEYQVSAVKSQPTKLESHPPNDLVPSSLLPLNNTNNQVVISLQNHGLVQGKVASNNGGLRDLTTSTVRKEGAVIKEIIAPAQQVVQAAPTTERQDGNVVEDESNSESEYDDNDDEEADDDDDMGSNPASLLPSNQFHGQLLAIPNGWLRKVVSTGSATTTLSQQQQKVFYYNPVGKRFSNQDEIDQYFAKLGYSVGLSLFNFDPPQQQQNINSKVNQPNAVSEHLNGTNKKPNTLTNQSKEEKRIPSIPLENMKRDENESLDEQKSSSLTKGFSKPPPRKKPKTIEKTQTFDKRTTEHSLSLKGPTKIKLSPEIEKKQSFFVAVKTDPYTTPTSVFDGKDINGGQNLGIFFIFVYHVKVNIILFRIFIYFGFICNYP